MIARRSPAVIEAVDHPKCVPSKCGGSAPAESRRKLKAIVKSEFVDLLKRSEDYADFLRRFKCAEGMKVELPEIDEEG